MGQGVTMKARGWTMLRILGVGAVAAALVVAIATLPVREWTQSFIEWIQQLGPIGVAAFGVVYVLAVVVLFPTWLLTVSAGVAFGLWAIPMVVVAATIGAVLAFLIARRAFREKVRGLAQRRPLLQALDKATRVEGWKVVALLRLSPVVPFNLQNYAFGATDISLVHFAASTFLGIVPGTALYVYIGSVGRAAADSEALKTTEIVLFSIGLLATILVVVVLTRKARQMLDEIGLAAEQRS